MHVQVELAVNLHASRGVRRRQSSGDQPEPGVGGQPRGAVGRTRREVQECLDRLRSPPTARNCRARQTTTTLIAHKLHPRPQKSRSRSTSATDPRMIARGRDVLAQPGFAKWRATVEGEAVTIVCVPDEV